MLKWILGDRAGKAGKAEAVPSYEESREISSSGSAEERRKLASMSQLQPEFLYYFASDKSVDVRREVARNEGTPIQADLILARDPDEFVKKDLCKKVGRLLPSLSSEEHRNIAEMAFEVVEILSKDGLPEVRAMIAEEVRGLDTVPPRIVQRLARDTEAIVASPVLEFSPLLNDGDLLDIILAGTRGAALAAIGRRENISDEVGSAIVKTEDDRGVTALVENASAKLSEKTLTAIVDLAEDRPNWQEALAGRRNLSLGLVQRMGRYISINVLDKLIENNVLVDAAVEEELRGKVEERLGEIHPEGEEESAANSDDDDRMRAEALFAKGELTSAIATDAASNGDREFLVHAISLMSEGNVTAVRRLLSDKDPKLAVAIAWKCGLGMRFATTLQTSIMQVPAANVIEFDDSDTNYPMSEDDMHWALEVADIEK